ncbi:MAG: homoserine kinase [Acidobacteria bacterium]|nr:homoserine kinase [Acidobacteriota bacterium]
MDEVTVLAPCSVSNVVCGFDCLGFVLQEPYDRVTVRRSRDEHIRITHLDNLGLSTDPVVNVAGVAIQALIDALDVDHGFEMEITKGAKPGSGIGSSAASACGAVLAANALLGSSFSRTELINFAMAGEAVASGARHADNLAPCILGGFTLVRSIDPLDVVELSFPPIYATVIHPQIEIKTIEARAMLPENVPLKNAIQNWSNLGAFVAGLAARDYDLISRSMVDALVEPLREALIPGYHGLKNAGLEAGALGGGISGAGPSVFMLSETKMTAQNVESAMRDVYSKTGIEFRTYVSAVRRGGAATVR